MTLLDRFERHLARFTIPGLMRYVVALNALVYILLNTNPSFGPAIVFNQTLILQGQIWRLVSWLFIPGSSNILYVLIYLYSIWWVGALLESAWGTFRLNVYYFLGMALCALSAWIFGPSNLLTLVSGNTFLNLSLFLALATLMPELEIILIIVPLKLKWAALLSVASTLILFVVGTMPIKMIVAMCLGNYLLFFGPQAVRNFRQRRSQEIRRVQFEAASDNSPYLHCCEVCGITELTHPHTDFRVAADGNEYCPAHQPGQPQPI